MMAGEKSADVSVEEAELRRLKEQASRFRAVQRDLPERLEQVRREADQTITIQGRTVNSQEI